MLDLNVLEIVKQSRTLDAVNLFINRFVVEKRVYPKLMHKGGTFLKKLWCCVGGRVWQGDLVLSIQLIT